MKTRYGHLKSFLMYQIVFCDEFAYLVKQNKNIKEDLYNHSLMFLFWKSLHGWLKPVVNGLLGFLGHHMQPLPRGYSLGVGWANHVCKLICAP